MAVVVTSHPRTTKKYFEFKPNVVSLYYHCTKFPKHYVTFSATLYYVNISRTVR